MFVIANVRIELNGPVYSILIGNTGKIINITSQAIKVADNAQNFDGRGALVLPAGVDPHVHFRCPGGEHKEDWRTGADAALAGGMTTVFDMPNTDPPLTTLKALEEKLAMVGQPKIDFRFWFGATVNNLKDIQTVAEHPAIIGVKVYMGSSTGDLLVTDERALRLIFQTCADLDLIVGMHAEDENIIWDCRKKLGQEEPKIFAHGMLRPPKAELVAVERALRLQKQTGCRLYFCHISTPEALKVIWDAKQKGAAVYAEVCPHHLFLDEGELVRANGGCFKVNPPLRAPDQVKRMLRLVCQDGFVDTFGSDHAPHTLEEKTADDYDSVPSGIPGVQTSFGLLFSLVMSGQMSKERFCALTSGNAAKIFRLTEKGAIQSGLNADLVIVDPQPSWLIQNSSMRSKCGWTPFHGHTVRGKIIAVFTKGKLWRF
ncbi:MAG: dihydroorotase family protein [bacterium]|nr:dihydroorotase family protein [bacterium]